MRFGTEHGLLASQQENFAYFLKCIVISQMSETQLFPRRVTPLQVLLNPPSPDLLYSVSHARASSCRDVHERIDQRWVLTIKTLAFLAINAAVRHAVSS